MESYTTVKDWIPLFSSLVTPIFLVLLIVWFRSDVADLLGSSAKTLILSSNLLNRLACRKVVDL